MRASTVAMSCSADSKHCLGTLNDLLHSDLQPLSSYRIIPDLCSSLKDPCECKGIANFSQGTTLELYRPNNVLEISSACGRITIVVSQPSTASVSDSYSDRGPACGVFTISQGNVALRNLQFDNERCVDNLADKYGITHRVEAAPVFVTGLRTAHNVHIDGLRLKTGKHHRWPAPPILAFFSSSSTFEQLHLSNVSIDHVTDATVKFDKCTGKVNMTGTTDSVVEIFPAAAAAKLQLPSWVNTLDLSMIMGPTLLYRLYEDSWILEQRRRTAAKDWSFYAIVGMVVFCISVIVLVHVIILKVSMKHSVEKVHERDDVRAAKTMLMKKNCHYRRLRQSTSSMDEDEHLSF